MQHFLHGGERNFYPRPPRGGRQSGCTLLPAGMAISIHALREEGDTAFRDWWTITKHISIHALREEGDPSSCFPAAKSHEISIHALREEGDCSGATLSTDPPNFYPRPPRGGRHLALYGDPRTKKFLSTPSARRATDHRLSVAVGRVYFYPRPPRGGRQGRRGGGCKCQGISIHALREEGDSSPHSLLVDRWNFYPRPPRGGRLGSS